MHNSCTGNTAPLCLNTAPLCVAPYINQSTMMPSKQGHYKGHIWFDRLRRSSCETTYRAIRSTGCSLLGCTNHCTQTQTSTLLDTSTRRLYYECDHEIPTITQRTPYPHYAKSFSDLVHHNSCWYPLFSSLPFKSDNRDQWYGLADQRPNKTAFMLHPPSIFQ